VRLRISPPGIKLAASNFARWFMGVLGMESPKIRRISARRQVLPIDASPLLTARSPSVEGTGVYRQCLPSACVDIRPSPRRRTYLFVCNFLCLYTVTDFSAEDKASGVKFCTADYRHPGKGFSHFGERYSPRSPK